MKEDRRALAWWKLRYRTICAVTRTSANLDTARGGTRLLGRVVPESTPEERRHSLHVVDFAGRNEETSAPVDFMRARTWTCKGFARQRKQEGGRARERYDLLL